MINDVIHESRPNLPGSVKPYAEEERNATKSDRIRGCNNIVRVAAVSLLGIGYEVVHPFQANGLDITGTYTCTQDPSATLEGNAAARIRSFEESGQVMLKCAAKPKVEFA